MSSYRENTENILNDKALFRETCKTIFDFIVEIWHRTNDKVQVEMTDKQGKDGNTGLMLYHIQGSFKMPEKYTDVPNVPQNLIQGHIFVNYFYFQKSDIQFNMLGLPNEISEFFMTLNYTTTKEMFPSPMGEEKFKVYIEIPVKDFSNFQTQLTMKNYEKFLKAQRFDL